LKIAATGILAKAHQIVAKQQQLDSIKQNPPRGLPRAVLALAMALKIMLLWCGFITLVGLAVLTMFVIE
jgi:hypothetical protein